MLKKLKLVRNYIKQAKTKPVFRLQSHGAGNETEITAPAH